MPSKPSLLILVHWFRPGFRAGGLTLSVQKMAEALASHYQIFVLSTNSDLGTKKPYPDIIADTWIKTNKGVQVKYLDVERLSYRRIKKEIIAIQPEILYLKGMFDPLFNLFPMWLKYKGHFQAKVVVAPSGMLLKSALKFKSWKKEAVLYLLGKSSLSSKLYWHVTDEEEAQYIRERFSSEDQITLLENFPPTYNNKITKLKKTKPLSLLFLSRIHPVKNLSFLLKVVERISAALILTIAGPIEDKRYYEECRQLIKTLPTNIQVHWLGLIPSEKVKPLLQKHHLFVLPTKGENYGYAIIEALAAARPVLISDQTPWRDLKRQKAGWDISLGEPGLFSAAIEELAAMDQITYDNYCEGALNYAKQVSNSEELVIAYRKMLELGISG